MRSLLLILILLPFSSYCQKFYVDAKDNYSKGLFERALIDLGYGVAQDEASSNYILKLYISGEYNPMAIKRTHEGYATIEKSDGGEEIFKSDIYKSTPAGINAFNASYDIARKIIKKELRDYLPKLPVKASSLKLFVKDNGNNIDKKLWNALRYDHEVVESENDANYIVDLYYHRKPDTRDPFRCYYKLHSKTGKLVYTSDEWKAGGTGGNAENHLVKLALKDLDEVLKEIIYQKSQKK